MSFLAQELERWKKGELDISPLDMAIYARRIVREENEQEKKKQAKKFAEV